MDSPRPRAFSTRGQIIKKSKNVEEENSRLRDMLQQALSREADSLRKLKHLQLKYMEILSKTTGTNGLSDNSPVLTKKVVPQYTLNVEYNGCSSLSTVTTTMDTLTTTTSSSAPSSRSGSLSTNGVNTTDVNPFPQLVVHLDSESEEDDDNQVTIQKVASVDGVASLAPLPQGLRDIRQEREKPPPLSGDGPIRGVSVEGPLKGGASHMKVYAQPSAPTIPSKPNRKSLKNTRQLSFSDEDISNLHRTDSDPSSLHKSAGGAVIRVKSSKNSIWKRKSRVMDVNGGHVTDIETLFKRFLESCNRKADDPLRKYLDEHWSSICLDSVCTVEERKYRDAVWEIFQAEVKYLTCQLQPLEQIYKNFLEELHFHGILTVVKTERVFGNLSQLIELTTTTATDLLKLFERRSSSNIAQINELILAFSMFGHNFNPVYKSYSTNLDQHRSYVKDIEKLPHFQEYVKVCRSAPSVMRNDIHDLLITPMQHQVHYKLLLENVLKRTQDPNHKETLSSVIQAFKVSLQELNSAIEANKTTLEFMDLCNAIYWPPVTQILPETLIPQSIAEFTRQQQKCCSEVLSSDRYLVMQGSFKLLDGKGKACNDLQLILLNDLLLVTEVIKNGSFKKPYQYEILHHPFPLDQIRVHRPPSDLRPILVLIPVSSIGQQLCAFTLKALSPGDRDKWYTQLLSMGSKLI